MEISDEVLKFLQDEESQELLNNNKFEKLYEKFHEEVEPYVPMSGPSMTSEFTQLLYVAGIDPLVHMSTVYGRDFDLKIPGQRRMDRDKMKQKSFKQSKKHRNISAILVDFLS